jgi:putative membrane protein
MVMMWYWGGGAHWWGSLLWTIGMVAFWGAIIWAGWYFVTGLSRRPGSEQGPGDAKRILDERLAQGEIDTEEYRRLLAVLCGEGVHAGNGQSPVGTGGRP